MSAHSPPPSRPFRAGILASLAVVAAVGILVVLLRGSPREAPPDGPAAAPSGPSGADAANVPSLRATVRAVLGGDGVSPRQTEAAIAALDRALPREATERPPAVLPPDVLAAAFGALAEPLSGNAGADAALRHSVAVSLQTAGRFPDAVPFETEALRGRRELFGDDDPRTLESLSNLGSLLNSAGRLDEALPLLREAVDRDRRVLGADDPQTLGAMNSTAAVLWRKGELDEAQDLLREALAGCRRVFGDDHAFTLSTANNLGVLLTEAGRLDEAIPLCREALAGRQRTLGESHPLTLQSMDSVVQALRAAHRLDDAILQARELLDRGTALLGEEHPQTLLWTITLGTLSLDHGQPAEALAVLAPAEGAARRALPEREPRRLGIFLAALGLARTRTGDFPAAKAALDDAWIVLGDPAVGSTSDLTYVLTNLVELEEAWEAVEPGAGHDEAAAGWRDELESLRGGAPSPQDP